DQEREDARGERDPGQIGDDGAGALEQPEASAIEEDGVATRVVRDHRAERERERSRHEPAREAPVGEASEQAAGHGAPSPSANAATLPKTARARGATVIGSTRRWLFPRSWSRKTFTSGSTDTLARGAAVEK